jgi:predicted LPLAT superfamily acyltransferase
MRLIHDPDEEPQAKPGEFPDPKPPRGRAWLLRLVKRNWLMLTVMAGVVSLLAVVSIFLAVRAAKCQSSRYRIRLRLP